MKNRFDNLVRDLRSRLSEYVERTRGRSVPESGNMRCPIPENHKNGDAHPSAKYYEDERGAHVFCQVCGNHDIFSLYAHDNGLGDTRDGEVFKKCVSGLCQYFGMPETPSPAYTRKTTPATVNKRRKPDPLPPMDEEIRRRLEENVRRLPGSPAADNLASRGISLENATTRGVGYSQDPDPLLAVTRGGHFTFPGTYGYTSRTITGAGKESGRQFDKSKGTPRGYMFNSSDLDTVPSTGTVFVVEGQFDALSITEAGGHAVAVGGTGGGGELVDQVLRKVPAASLVVAFDEDGAEETKERGEKLAADLRSAGAFVYTPARLFGYKDANDALLADREGFSRRLTEIAIEASQARATAEEESESPYLKYIISFRDFKEPLPDDENPDALTVNGYFRKTQSLGIISYPGAGKSVFAYQLAINWGLGKEFFLPRPIRPLRSFVVQYEDDKGDMETMISHDRKGLRRMGLTEEEIDLALANVDYLLVEKAQLGIGRTLADEELANMIAGVQRKKHYDVIIVNPLTSALVEYDLSDNSDANRFFRHVIDPVIKNPETKCGLIFVHHTGKAPKTATDRSGFMKGAFAQYDAQGAAALMNWVRASVMIGPTDTDEDFFFFGAKRHQRLGWTDSAGKPSRKIYGSYSPDIMYWIRTPEERVLELEAEEEEEKSSRIKTRGPDPSEDAGRLATHIKQNTHNRGVAMSSTECLRLGYSILDNQARGNAAWKIIKKDPAAFSLETYEDGKFVFYAEKGVPPPATVKDRKGGEFVL